MKKLFKFEGTINGLNYFLRSLLIYPALYVVAYASSIFGEFMIIPYLVGAVFILWFGLATFWKRVAALHPGKENEKFVWYFILGILPLVGFILHLYLLFKDSGIEKHEG